MKKFDSTVLELDVFLGSRILDEGSVNLSANTRNEFRWSKQMKISHSIIKLQESAEINQKNNFSKCFDHLWYKKTGLVGLNLFCFEYKQ